MIPHVVLDWLYTSHAADSNHLVPQQLRRRGYAFWMCHADSTTALKLTSLCPYGARGCWWSYGTVVGLAKHTIIWLSALQRSRSCDIRLERVSRDRTGQLAQSWSESECTCELQSRDTRPRTLLRHSATSCSARFLCVPVLVWVSVRQGRTVQTKQLILSCHLAYCAKLVAEVDWESRLALVYDLESGSLSALVTNRCFR
jgi:hypothetical protein|eukprot:COSAG02_NODE_438_length_22319_cov_17.198425_14_plen_200_part_00